MNKKENNSYKTAFQGTTIILIGFIFLIYNYVALEKIKAYDYLSHAVYNEKTEEVENLAIEVKEEEEEEEVVSEEYTNDYIGYLIIPKINLTKGFLDSRSELNHVDQNLQVVEGSSYPSKKNGNFIIAGHSGTAWNSFFNDLYQLQLGDIAIVEYKGKKYTYKVTNIYTQQKTGKIAIYRNNKKTTMTLITCTNNDETTQTIYILELDNIEE